MQKKIVFVFLIVFISGCEAYNMANFQATPNPECFSQKTATPSDVDVIVEKMKNNSKIQLVDTYVYVNKQKKRMKYHDFKIKATLKEYPSPTTKYTPTIRLAHEEGNYSLINLTFEIWVQDFTRAEKDVLQEILNFLEKEFQEINGSVYLKSALKQFLRFSKTFFSCA